MDQQEGTFLLEGDISAAQQKSIGQAGGYGGNAVGGARTNDHGVNGHRAAGEGTEEIGIVVAGDSIARPIKQGCRR